MGESRKKFRFVPEGGFAGAFAIIEENSTAAYSPDRYLSVVFEARDLEYARSWGRKEEWQEGNKELLDVSAESLTGMADLVPSRFGQHRLSLFGSDNEHTKATFCISSNTTNRCEILPVPSSSDPYDPSTEHFVVHVHLNEVSFRELRAEIDRMGAYRVMLSVSVGRMKGVYTTSSDIPEEGRLIKFLGDKYDVENHQEMPDGVHGMEIRSDVPFNLALIKV